MEVRIVWKAVAGIGFRAEGDSLLVEAPPRPAARVPIGDVVAARVLSRLTDGIDEQVMADAVHADGGDVARLARNFALMRGAALLEADIVADGERLATARAYAREFAVPPPRPAAMSLQLSRFTMLRPGGEGWLMEHPESSCGVQLHGEAVWQCLHEAARAPLAPTHRLAAVLDVLAQLGFLVEAGRAEPPAERTWEFHDRWFQRRARQYDDFLPVGSTYRFAREFAAPPPIRAAYPAIEIGLPAIAPRPGSGLYDVLDTRRSRRDMARETVRVPEIAELLWRSVRTIEVIPATPQETLRRPFPAGGGIHELEFYLVAGDCDGLAPGLYHYTARHSLAQLVDTERHAMAMLEGCGGAWGQPDRPPQAMIVIASRLPRLAWKYQGIAYKLSLLNTGAALQTLSLVCEELGLAGTIAGSGDPRLFAAATGNSTWEETSIAEFGFGRRAA